MVSHNDRRTNGWDTLVTVPALRPSARSLLSTWSTTPSYTAVRLPASRWSTYPAFHEVTRASTTGRGQSRIMDNPGGKASQRTLPGVTGTLDVNIRVSLPAREIYVLGGTGLDSDLPTLD